MIWGKDGNWETWQEKVFNLEEDSLHQEKKDYREGKERQSDVLCIPQMRSNCAPSWVRVRENEKEKYEVELVTSWRLH